MWVKQTTTILPEKTQKLAIRRPPLKGDARNYLKLVNITGERVYSAGVQNVKTAGSKNLTHTDVNQYQRG
jgi:hypothetical protein